MQMKARALIEDRYRSLLQKAVRRGNTELVYTASALIESLDGRSAAWLETRTAVIMFAECWPLAAEMLFTKPFHSKVAALLGWRTAKRRGMRPASASWHMPWTGAMTRCWPGSPTTKRSG